MRRLPVRLRLPGVCYACRRPVSFDGIRWVEGTPRHYRKHVCPSDRPLCGAWMARAQERCARGPHANSDHRTRYALDNAARRWAAWSVR